MSILVKGMELPENCAECFVAWERCHRTIEWYKNNPQYYDIRHEDCPLVEVPPHGRLIDADVVARDLQEMSEDIEKSFPYLDKNDALMIERGIQFARQYVLNLAPTIIKAEEGEVHDID